MISTLVCNFVEMNDRIYEHGGCSVDLEGGAVAFSKPVSLG